MRHATILFAAMLAGCASDCPKLPPPPPWVIDTSCDWIPAMTASASDTVETKREIIAYETARQKNCRSHRGTRTTISGE